VVSTDDRELVSIRIELFAGQHGHWLHRGEIQSDAPGRRGHVLEQCRNLVASWHELTHHLEALLILGRLRAHLLQAALRDVRARLLIALFERVDVRLYDRELGRFRLVEEIPVGTRSHHGHEADRRQCLLALGHVCADSH
jgi:hypothetical protein